MSGNEFLNLFGVNLPALMEKHRLKDTLEHAGLVLDEKDEVQYSQEFSEECEFCRRIAEFKIGGWSCPVHHWPTNNEDWQI
jgi:hypothetical protein